MASFKPRLFLQFRFPSTVSLFGLTTRSFSSASGEPALCTRRIQRRPSPAATRESPTPIIFVRSPGLSVAEQEENAATWADWSGMFAEKGYTAIEIDIQPPPYSPQPFAMMVGALATEIRLLAIPFPPVIVAEGMGCLLTQSYIGDNPASGLIMVNPPPDADPRKVKGTGGGSWEWPVFNYEPHFPILVIAEKANLATLQSTNRVVKAAEAGVGRGGKGVSVEELVDGPRGEKSRVEVERWMDRCGY